MEIVKKAFACDYMEGAHPKILERLMATNLEKTPGYGLDAYSESARAKIREVCGTPDAEIQFLVGGTQTNATVIDALLSSYQGVIAAETGHIATHEAGAIEFGGHKVLTLPEESGKIVPKDLERFLECFYQDGNRDHMVMPGMVYISQPTEYGTLYLKKELEAISVICKTFGIPLYLDGARLAYALGSPENDISLKDIADLCDVFYIGGTKCGTLFGEAVVIPDGKKIPHFFTIIKQHGALLAKGRITGIQFDTLFTEDLYFKLGEHAIAMADRLRKGLEENGVSFRGKTRTNQIFVELENTTLEKWESFVEFSFWESLGEDKTVIRLATSWATTQEDVDELIQMIKEEGGQNAGA